MICIYNKIKDNVLSYILNIYMSTKLYKDYIYLIYRFEQQIKENKINKDNKDLFFNLRLYKCIPLYMKEYLYNKYNNDTVNKISL